MNSQVAATQPFLIRAISLANSPRRAVFSERAKTHLDWDFFDAQTSNTTGLPYGSRRAELIHGRALTPNELGCFASHYGLWRLCAQANQPVIVFEDDVDPDWSFLEALAQDYQPYAGIEFLRFWGLYETLRADVGDILDRKIVELLGQPYGGQGYLLTPSYANRLLKRLRYLQRPVDEEIDRHWCYGARNLIVDPPPMSLRDEPSEIGDRLSIQQLDQSGFLRTVADIFEKMQRKLYITIRRVRLRAI